MITARFFDRHISPFQDKLACLAKNSEEAEARLKSDLESESSERREEAKRIEDFFRAENDARKKNLEDVNEWIREENEKRMKEAEALKVNYVTDKLFFKWLSKRLVDSLR